MLDTMMPFGESSHSLANFPDCNVMSLGGVLNEFVHQRKSDSTYVPIAEYDPFITCLDNHDSHVPDLASPMATTHLELQQSQYETLQRYQDVNDSINWGSDCESGEDNEEEEDEDDEEDEVFELGADDVTQDSSPDRLLNFAKIVTNNVKAIMSRNEGNEDYCDIFEDRFKSTLSGRALYYADLLAVAQPNSTEVRKGRHNQNGGAKLPCSFTAATSSSSSASTVPKPVANDQSSTRGITICYDATGEVETGEVSIATGKRNEKVGLGPLERLFMSNNAIQVETQTQFIGNNGPNLKRPLLNCDYNDSENPGGHFGKQLRMEDGLFYGFDMEQSTLLQRETANSSSYQDILKKSEYWQSQPVQPSCSSNTASNNFIRTPDFSDISVEWEAT